jgi:cell division septation protein DedD
MIGAGLAGSVLLAGGIIWGMSMMGPRGVPLIETDGRPFKVRPDAPGGAVVPHQQELIFERNGSRQDRPGEARLGPPPETPRPEALRAQSQPAPAPAPMPAPASAAPAAAQPPARPAAAPAPAQQTARPAPATGGRFMVQFAATRSEESARAEWERLQRRVPELAGRQPIITRLERDGQPTLWRVRTGGFADAAAARAFCGPVRAREVACITAGG